MCDESASSTVSVSMRWSKSSRIAQEVVGHPLPGGSPRREHDRPEASVRRLLDLGITSDSMDAFLIFDSRGFSSVDGTRTGRSTTAITCRYPSDLTDDEWHMSSRLSLQPNAAAASGGRTCGRS